MATNPASAEQTAIDDEWQQILACIRADGGGHLPAGPLADLFGPLLAAMSTGGFVVAHLGQSLDGRIAVPDGRSHHVTGRIDAIHIHRLRAMCDAVIVGAAAAAAGDPELTVRLVEGDNPVRVVIDPARRLDPGLGLFSDRAAETLLLCAAGADAGATRHGEAEIVALAADDTGKLLPQSIVETLAVRGLTRLFVEGGGVTVSHFVTAGLVDRLHITVAPLLLGDGPPVLTLPAISRIDAARRVTMRPFVLGDDLLYDCVLDDRSS